MQKKNIFQIFLLILFPLLPLSASGIFESSEEPVQEEAVPAVQELYDAQEETVPSIGLFLPEVQGDIPPEVSDRIYGDLAKAYVRQNLFKPYSLNEWLAQEYPNTGPRDILEIGYRIRKDRFPLDYFSTVNISRFADKYFLMVAVYPRNTIEDVIYSYRILDNLSSEWEFLLPDILNEIQYRLEQKQEPHQTSTIYVEPFPVKFYQYYEIQNGEFSFTELPFMTLDGADFRADEDIVSQWMGMRLHLSGFFPVLIHDLKSKTRADVSSRATCQWGLKGEIRISQRLSVLRLQIFDYRRREILASYDIPFSGLKAEDVSDVIDRSLPFILNTVLSDEARKRIVMLDTDFPLTGDRIYTASGYQGPWGMIHSIPGQVGLNRFLIVSDEWHESEDKNLFQKSEVVRELYLPDLSSYNTALLVGPDGRTVDTYLEKDILYAEKIFE